MSNAGQARRCIAIGVRPTTWLWLGLLPFACEALGEFFVDMHADAFLVVHHSDPYVRTYRLAYRVVLRRFLAGIVSSTRQP
jgi:hypothetical protein